jgi:hypothetical protein
MLIKEETHSDAVLSRPESRAHGQLPDQDETDNLATEEQVEASDTSTLQGLCIAAATFLPTFLAVFLGIPYLLGLPVSVRLPDVPENRPQPAMSVMAPSRNLLPSLPEPTLTKPSDSPAESSLQPRGETPAAAPIGNRGPQSSLGAPTIAPAWTQAVPRDQSRAMDSKRSGARPREERAWTLAAAFKDQESAARLAASIERRGYPTKIRREESAERPWVVWIGKQPRGRVP